MIVHSSQTDGLRSGSHCTAPGGREDRDQTHVKMKNRPRKHRRLGEKEPGGSEPGGGWGWLVTIGSFVEMFLTMGISLCSGVYFTSIQVEFEASSAELGWIISSGTTLLAATCPIGSACVKRFGCRMTSLMGGIAVSCGYIATSFASSSIHIFITLGLVAGIGSGLVFVSATVILGHYFKQRYAIVNGLAFSGPGVAVFVLPPLLDYLIDSYGWRGALVIQGGISLHILVAASLFRPLPSETGCHGNRRKLAKKSSTLYSKIEMKGCDNDNVENPEIDSNLIERVSHDVVQESVRLEGEEDVSLSMQGTCCEGNDSREHLADNQQRKADIIGEMPDVKNTLEDEQLKKVDEICGDKSKRSRRFSLDSFSNNCWLSYVAAFILMCPVSFFQACAFYSVTFHVVASTGMVGVSSEMAGMSLSVLGAGSSFTRLTHGWFIHRGLVTPYTAYIVALAVGALGAFGNVFSKTYAGVLMSCLVVGLSSGAVYPLVPVVLRDLVSLRGLPTTYGLAMFFDSCGAFAGGFTAGLLRDVTGTYTASFCMTGVYYTIAAVFQILVVVLMRIRRRREHDELNNESAQKLGTDNSEQESVSDLSKLGIL